MCGIIGIASHTPIEDRRWLDAIQEEMSDLMVQYREQIVAAIELETKNNK